MSTAATPPSCFYCGKSTAENGTREHVVPRNLGGFITIPDVCGPCNREVLSRLDEDLRVRSVLAPIASEELGTSVGLSWDVAESQSSLLLEAQPFRQFGYMKVW